VPDAAHLPLVLQVENHRLGPHDGPPPDAARAAGQLGVRAHPQGLLGAHPGPLRRQGPTQLQHDRTPH
ncbi:hypothetical protein ABTL91_20510, partial [Acinetobacter baumannii]